MSRKNIGGSGRPSSTLKKKPPLGKKQSSKTTTTKWLTRIEINRPSERWRVNSRLKRFTSCNVYLQMETRVQGPGSRGPSENRCGDYYYYCYYCYYYNYYNYYYYYYYYKAGHFQGSKGLNMENIKQTWEKFHKIYKLWSMLHSKSIFNFTI